MVARYFMPWFGLVLAVDIGVDNDDDNADDDRSGVMHSMVNSLSINFLHIYSELHGTFRFILNCNDSHCDFFELKLLTNVAHYIIYSRTN